MAVPALPPGALHVVATPIGNLEDITMRALRVLREVSLIAAEDTRRSGKLLSHYGIATPTISYHEHNARSRLPQLLERLAAGESIALVTDAGTPGISDPGTELVAACIARAIPVEPVPGVSAALAAAVASGFPLGPLTIFGFPPHRSNDRTRWLHDAFELDHSFTFFEAPHRIELTIRAIADLSGERQIVLAREVTKVHQEFLRGTVGELLALNFTRKGEFTVVIGPQSAARSARATCSDDEVAHLFGRLADSGQYGSRRAVIGAVARTSGRPAREVYALLERRKNSGE